MSLVNLELHPIALKEAWLHGDGTLGELLSREAILGGAA
jgi:hypothetical protein